jgi:parallel beta-helix repeat protein
MKKFSHVLVIIMLIIGLMPVIIPLTNYPKVVIAQEVKPNDNNNGTSTQYLTGEWNVTGTESYSDESIVLTGNLSIKSGGSLTLKNVTLAMNCTFANATYTIEVLSGGTLIIMDGDNDPSTTSDRSNITDSPFDIDDRSPADYRTAVRVYPSTTLSIENSLVRECGAPYVGSENVGLYVDTHNANIQNCTFVNMKNGIRADHVNYLTIGYNEFKYCDEYGVYFTWCHYIDFFNNNIHHCEEGAFIASDNGVIRNNYIHNNSDVFKIPGNDHGLTVWWSDYTDIYNNTIENNGGKSGSYQVEFAASSYITFYNNTIQKSKSGTAYPIVFGTAESYHIHNNSFINNNGWGFYIAPAGFNQVTRIYDNIISDNTYGGMFFNSWGGEPLNLQMHVRNNYVTNNPTGLRIQELRAYDFRNNTFINCSSDGLYINDMHNGELANCTFNGNQYDIYINDTLDLQDTEVIVVNCSFNLSKTHFGNSAVKLIIKNYLHVNVTDVKGFAPYIPVTVRDVDNNIVYEGETDENGWIRYIKLTNQSKRKNVAKYYDPHNVSAVQSIYTAYGNTEPIMNQTRTVNVHFNIDIPPNSPTNLTAKSNGTKVELNWYPSPSPDIHHYIVYRNLTGNNWELIYNSSYNIGQETATSWADPLGASNASTYFYRIVAVDTGWQKSDPSNLAECGDWAVAGITTVTNLNLAVNGTLTVLPTGHLTLINADVKFNNSFELQYGIEVQTGGKLNINDYDNNPLTTNDQSHISVLNPAYNFYFIVEGSEFSIRNSKISECGSDQLLTSQVWSITAGSNIMSIGDPKIRGVYISCNNIVIENSDFTDNYVSLLLNEIYDFSITDNTFTNNEFGIYLNDVNNSQLHNNIFYIHDGYPIYLLNSWSNTISDNVIIYPNSPEASIGLYGSGCSNNKIIYNNIKSINTGVYIYDGSSNNEISNNTFEGQEWSLDIFSTSWNIIMDNQYYNTDTSIHLEESHNSILYRENSNIMDFGVSIKNCNNLKLYDLTIENASNTGIDLNNGNNVNVMVSTIKSCYFGIYIWDGSTFTLFNLTIEQCSYGIYTGSNPLSIKIYNTIIHKSTTIAVYLENTPDPVIMVNCTLQATNQNFRLYTTSYALLYNTTYDQNKIFIDPSSSISLYWYLHVRVLDWMGNPVPNADVQIRKALGTLVFFKKTDIDGGIKWIWLIERTQYSQSNEYATPYLIQASSGNHSGSLSHMLTESTNVTIYLENTAPQVSNIILQPSNPTTISDLELDYEYSDDENDQEGSSMILWYVNGVHNTSHNNKKTILSSFTHKGQTWFCEIIPNDGTTYGTPMTSMPVSIQNTPPTATNVTIDETSPSSSDDLHINYTFFDIDDDPETRSSHRWLVNDGSGWQYSGYDTMELSWIYTKKGENWKCEVTPSDGDSNGITKSSQVVTIGNTAPEITGAVVIPEFPESNQSLNFKYEYYDLDNDPESGSIIQWFKNDQEQLDLNGSISISPTLTSKGDKWHYIVIPFDGEQYGTPVQSSSVYIENTPPKILNIEILPENPTTADDLTVTYEFYDEDGDTESFDTIVEWLKWSGVEFTHTGLRVKTLSSSYTTKNEIWTCEITPHDNLTYGDTVRCNINVTIQNLVPSVMDVEITPLYPKTDADLVANYDYIDLDDDPEDGTEISWFRDSAEVLELKNQLTISRNFTEKGQVWHFTVRPKDGLEFGNIVESQKITIQNSKPTATNLTISPPFPLGDDNLKASYIFFDIDNDTESASEIRWYKNGLLQAYYNDKYEVNSSSTEKGDLWYFTLRVNDGTDYSYEISSHYIIVENTKPQINSVSPVPSPIEINETKWIEFTIDAIDPDGDLLLYKWKLGKTTVSDDEYYNFTTDYLSSGIYILNLTLQDVGTNSFAISYLWEITVTDVNRLPTIEVIEPITPDPKMKEDTSLQFQIAAHDPDPYDVKNLLITWYFDDVVAQSSGSTYTYHADYAAAGDHVVTVVVSDLKDNVEYSWNLTVENVVEVEETEKEEGALGLSWDLWGILLEVIVLSSTGILAFIGYQKLRKKKGALKIYMVKIEDISELKEKNPAKFEKKLNELEEQINKEFKEGKIEDLHYLMLQEIIASKRGDVRRAEVTRKFQSLPKGIADNLDDMLKDGKITRDEYIAFVSTIQKSQTLTPYERQELSQMVEKWEVEDTGDLEDDKLTRRLKGKEKVELDEWEPGDDELNED